MRSQARREQARDRVSRPPLSLAKAKRSQEVATRLRPKGGLGVVVGPCVGAGPERWEARLTRVRLRTNRSSTSWRTWSWFLSRNLCT